MRPSRLLAVLLLLALAVLSPVMAQTTVYSVTVPVADTTQPVRDQAFASALTQVLARANGGADPRTKPGYAEAMKQPGGLVQQYQYARATGGAGSPMSLEVTFDPGAIRRVLSVGDSAAAAPKAPVLVIVRDATGKVLAPESLIPLTQMADTRGYPVVSPKTDNVPDPAAIAGADATTLASIARQYNTAVILQGTVDTGGDTDWTLVSAGRSQSWKDSGEALPALLANGANAMADRLDRQFVSSASGSSSGKVWVSGLRSAADYAALLATFQNDPAVRSVATLSAQNDGVLLSVSASAPLARLVAGYAAEGHILAADGHEGADISTRWVP
ncbi:hypothetical protein EC912_104286 [Luteibacter rhizovicinus]|uniref:DUF2066 domain-containing protein n=1 Tax=Luteibacter rhizovicinus TaxID=242606 RepID=A0A4V2W403_9GAMM|nr:DUF2066 domain-containing protein [Luteibacter rhizovicinus]TCV94089.1 hypothetical protein EC912_104286 [Luteibacter rhizovicinus]